MAVSWKPRMTPPPRQFRSLIPNKKGDHPSTQLQLYIKSNGSGPTDTSNRAELAGILEVLRQPVFNSLRATQT
eukprot:1143742-Pelagomonas_calceolata.AAC.2